MAYISSRRDFVKQASVLVAGARLTPWLRPVAAADLATVIATTATGKVRGDENGRLFQEASSTRDVRHSVGSKV